MSLYATVSCIHVWGVPACLSRLHTDGRMVKPFNHIARRLIAKHTQVERQAHTVAMAADWDEYRAKYTELQKLEQVRHRRPPYGMGVHAQAIP